MTYLQEFSLLRTARIGVIATRTTETRRAVDLLASYAATGESETAPVYKWDIRSGWQKLKYGKPSIWQPHEETTTDPIDAVQKIPEFDKGAIAIMIHPQDLLESGFGKQVISDFCFQFQDANGHTLVMVMPLSTQLPEEITSEITLLDLPLPTPDLFCSAVEEKIGKIKSLTSSELSSLASAATGMTMFEAEKAYAKAAAEHIDTIDTVPVPSLITSVLNAKTEVIRKSKTLELYPPVSMSEVGGHAGIKQWVDFNRVRLDPAMIARGATPLMGSLFVGPPGNGKSLCAKGLASGWSIPLIRFDLAACFGGLVGESEANMDATMKVLKALGSCVCWIDEIDKAGLSAGAGGDSGASSRMLQKLLYEMQEMKSGVFWAVTANDVTKVPVELLRPGRLDKNWYVGPPNAQDRLAVIAIHLRKQKQKVESSKWAEFVEATNNFSAAELEQCVTDSVTYILNKNVPLTERVMIAHAQRIIPFAVSFKKQVEKMAEWGKTFAADASMIVDEIELSSPTVKPSAALPAMIRRPVSKR